MALSSPCAQVAASLPVSGYTPDGHIPSQPASSSCWAPIGIWTCGLDIANGKLISSISFRPKPTRLSHGSLVCSLNSSKAFAHAPRLHNSAPEASCGPNKFLLKCHLLSEAFPRNPIYNCIFPVLVSHVPHFPFLVLFIYFFPYYLTSSDILYFILKTSLLG